MRIFFLLLTITVISCSNNSIEKNKKLVAALNDSSISPRGTLVRINTSEFRLDYYDVLEKDSYIKELTKMKYQGGGYSWEGIVYGAIKLSDETILQNIRFDPEAEGLAIWSTNEESLTKIGRLIAVIKSDQSLLIDCIKVAKSDSRME